MVENSGGACKNPWWLARGKRFPVWFCWLLWAEVYPAGRCGPWRGKIPEADSGERVAPDPGLRGWHCRVGAGFGSEGGDLDLLVADAQHEVMQGAAKDGRLASRTPSVSGRGHQAAVAAVGGGGGVVSSGGMFGSTQCLRKLLKKNV